MKHYSVTQAAELLNVTTGYLRQQILSGRLEASKLGSFWVISQKQLTAFARQRKTAGRPKKK